MQQRKAVPAARMWVGTAVLVWKAVGRLSMVPKQHQWSQSSPRHQDGRTYVALAHWAWVASQGSNSAADSNWYLSSLLCLIEASL